MLCSRASKLVVVTESNQKSSQISVSKTSQCVLAIGTSKRSSNVHGATKNLASRFPNKSNGMSSKVFGSIQSRRGESALVTGLPVGCFHYGRIRSWFVPYPVASSTYTPHNVEFCTLGIENPSRMRKIIIEEFPESSGDLVFERIKVAFEHLPGWCDGVPGLVLNISI